MTTLTERERKIMEMLRKKKITEIAKELGIPHSSVSRSIIAIKLKMFELKSEVEFLEEIGFLKIENNELKFISKDMSPKALYKRY